MSSVTRCPKCGNQMIATVGKVSSKLVLVGEFPGHEEIIQGQPFVGKTGDVLKYEMVKVGLMFRECKVTNLWKHAVDEKNCDVSIHLKLLIEDLDGHKYALLMGSEIAKVLYDTNIMSISGLVNLPSPYLPKNLQTVLAPNPASLFHGAAGELRLALTRLKELIND